MSSWNSTRNPKELKEMVASTSEHHCHQEGAPTVLASLSKLRGLAEDDKTENALLRSRIDEQSQLIMILKQRSDENIASRRALEETNSALEQSLQMATLNVETAAKRFGVLERRFFDLSGNHDEMILLKDEYKTENVLLRGDNDGLRQDNEALFSGAISELDSEISELRVSLLQSQADNVCLSTKYRESAENLAKAECKKTTDSIGQRQQIERLENRLKELSDKVATDEESRRTSEKTIQSQICCLKKDNTELLALTMHRGQLIQEKQTEMKGLQQQLFEVNKSVEDERLKFLDAEAAVNADVCVRQMKQSLADSENTIATTQREYDAYKKHSKQLLEKERSLNAKLRHLVS